jgi:hypothetical protein
MFRLLSRPLTVCAALVVLIAGCASGPEVDPQLTAALAARNVNKDTYNKIYNGRVLDYVDIVNLVRADVPTHIIVSYLQSTEKAYNFTYSQLRTLRQAGAAPQLLNYLSETHGFYAHVPPQQAARVAKQQQDAYYNDPAAQAEAPFGYNPPLVDTWFDSGYEESLYSPFSFN